MLTQAPSTGPSLPVHRGVGRPLWGAGAQSWGIDGQVNSPLFGLIRPRNLCLAVGVRAQAPGRGSGRFRAWGVAVGCLRLEVRSPGSLPGLLCQGMTFLPWLRERTLHFLLVGPGGDCAQDSTRSSWISQATNLRKEGCYLQWS